MLIRRTWGSGKYLWPKVRPYFFISCLFLTCSLSAQNHVAEMGGFYGKLMNIYPGFPPRNAHNGLFLQWRKERVSPWAEKYGTLQTGLSATWHNLGNRKILGQGYGLQYDFRLFQPLAEKWSLTEFFQFGGIYNTRPYHYLDNTDNIVTGSSFSFLISAGLGVQWQFSERGHLSAGGMLWHSSNGHTALPNVGMNSPVAFVGLGRSFGPATKSPEAYPDSAVNGWSPFLVAGMGMNEAGGTVRPTNAPLYYKYLTGIGISKRFADIHRVMISVEGYYNAAYRVWNESQEVETSYTEFASASAVMVLLGHEFLYGRFGLAIQAGYNLFNPTLAYLVHEVETDSKINRVKAKIPGRISMRYYLAHPWRHRSSPFIYLGIKSNLGQADFLETGVGFGF